MMRLIDPLEINESDFNDFINEFKVVKEELVPYSLKQKDMDFQAYIKSLKDESLGNDISENWVPASTYFLMNDKGKICGAVSIRHKLNENLKIEGGHIGYGIRPSVRKQGYGTIILELALDKVRGMGIKKALVTCEKENFHSARIIQKNGGIFDSEIEKDNKIIQRYWIEL